MKYAASDPALPSVFEVVIVFVNGFGHVVVGMVTKVCLCLLGSLEFHGDLGHTGKRQQAMKLWAGTDDRDSTPAGFQLAGGVDDDGQYCGAGEASQAEIQNQGSGAIIDCDGQSLADFLSDQIVDCMMGAQENDAVSAVAINGHRED